MTFEEFFKKKKINLQTLEQGEPGLFSEFRAHYEQMGEKSFDHTKKYWFNKLRLRFPAPVEVKVEKVAMENRLAEQTITESLVESASPPPNIGFKPKFRAGLTKPAETSETSKEEIPNTETALPTTDSTTEAPKPALGFKPKFKAGVTKNADTAAEPEKAADAPEEKPQTSSPPPSLGFKPKFRAGVTKATEPLAEQNPEAKGEEDQLPPTTNESTEAKPAYKPRFNMNKIKPKGEE